MELVKLHLGSGRDYKEGWTNIDLDRGDLQIDLGKELLSQFEDESVDYIYSQHFLEHLNLEEGLALLKDCRRVLKRADSVMRISTPNIKEAVDCYVSRKLDRFGKTFDTPAQIFADFYLGHEYVYDWEELQRVLSLAGFSSPYRMKPGVSEFEHLRNLETRPDFNDLIVEVVIGPHWRTLSPDEIKPQKAHFNG